MWRRALIEDIELNGTAGRLRTAVAERIRSEPRPAPRARHPRQSHAREPRRTLALLALVVLLTIAFNALAAFGPPLRTGATRLWNRITARDPNCDQPPPVNRTPPGGTEDPGGRK